MSETNYDRRHKVILNDGTEISFSIPAGCANEDAEFEASEIHRNIKRGYTQKAYLDPGLRIDVRWLVRQHPIVRWAVTQLQQISRWPRYIDRVLFWLKCRWLDLYWGVKDSWKKV